MALVRVRWIPRLLRWIAPFRKSEMEAADHYLGKKAKVQTLHDLTMARDFQELAEADRAKVELLHKKHGMDLGGKKTGDRDTWACDDMTINAGSSSGPLWLILGLLLGAAALWWFSKPATPEAASVPDSEYEVRFFDRDGNQITVPRMPVNQ